MSVARKLVLQAQITRRFSARCGLAPDGKSAESAHSFRRGDTVLLLAIVILLSG